MWLAIQEGQARRKKAAARSKPARPEAALVRTLPSWPQPAVTSPAFLATERRILCSVISKASLASGQARAEMLLPLGSGFSQKHGLVGKPRQSGRTFGLPSHFCWGSPFGEWDWGGHLGKVFPGSGFLLAQEGQVLRSKSPYRDFPMGCGDSPAAQGSPASHVSLAGITVQVQEGQSERQELNGGNSTVLSPPWRFCAGFPGL